MIELRSEPPNSNIALQHASEKIAASKGLFRQARFQA